LVADNWATPIRSTVEGEFPAVGSTRPPQDPPVADSTASTAVVLNSRIQSWRRRRPRVIRYFLFNAGSSTQLAQNPLGFMLDAFFTILIFIVVS
jgi:hypothetical protein